MNGSPAVLLAALGLLAGCGSGAPAPATDGDVADGPPPAESAASSGSGAAGGGPSIGGAGGGPERLPTYLALGDSVAFGYNINHKGQLPDGTAKDLPDQAAHAIGYPEALVEKIRRDAGVDIEVASTACPGEAAGSLVTGKHADDNDCYENRHVYALHYEYDHEDYDFRDGTEANEENYGSGVSQLEHALAYLGDDPNRVKLITLTMGANDAARFAGAACNWADSLWDKGCLAVGALDAVLNEVQARWETTLMALAGSGYAGPIVVVLYYSPGYGIADLPMRAGIELLNSKIRAAGEAALATHPTLELRFVESYDVFQSLSDSFDDDPCEAGLTMMIAGGPDAGTCDIHPSNLGEDVLAMEVWKALTLEQQQALLGG